MASGRPRCRTAFAEHLISSPGTAQEELAELPATRRAPRRPAQSSRRAGTLRKLWSRKPHGCTQSQEERDFREASDAGRLAAGGKCSTQTLTALLASKANRQKKNPKKQNTKKKPSQKLFNIIENILSSLIYHGEQAATLQDFLSTFFLTLECMKTEDY